MKHLLPFFFLLFLTCISCKNKAGESKQIVKDSATLKLVSTKPPSTYTDTLKIDVAAAVLYHPDSLQRKKIGELMDPGVFEASTHEYFYQMRNARNSIKKDWPAIKIVEAMNVRYILFQAGQKDTVIDLDKKNDPYGMFLYQPGKAPHYADMMNIDSELWFYFKKQS